MKIKDIEYEIVYSKRKTLAVEVNREGSVIVRAPKGISLKRISAFLSNRYDWILSAITRQIQRAERYNLSKAEKDALFLKAKEYIPERTRYFSGIMGLVPNAVKISSATTRFGSCSGKNNLNFSFYLMSYPKEAIDYVIVHELAHIKYKNHSKEFYEFIESFLPDYKKREKILKK